MHTMRKLSQVCTLQDTDTLTTAFNKSRTIYSDLVGAHSARVCISISYLQSSVNQFSVKAVARAGASLLGDEVLLLCVCCYRLSDELGFLRR